MSHSINVKRLKENQPEVYEEYKLILLLAGSDEKDSIEWHEIEEHAGWDQTKDLFNKASHGYWDRIDLIMEEKDPEKQKFMMEQLIEDSKNGKFQTKK
ncbi:MULTISPECIES: hypothetical protein [Bacillus cereus group]|uniref:hypothetical protein n=1 Tax=Bacillus cereus group TaxID=86661 RepID=UPI001F579BFB|nr:MULTISPECIES: hypothetical protein [Bacillus cereus group]MCR6463210.1 hypothetical protein [Bacillus paranthracis]